MVLSTHVFVCQTPDQLVSVIYAAPNLDMIFHQIEAPSSM